MDILITTVGILAIYFLIISFFVIIEEELTLLISVLVVISFSIYLWDHYDFAFKIIVR